MKRYRRFIRRIDYTLRCYWFPLTLGFLISGGLVIAERNIRGRFAIGGEWLFPVFLCIIHSFLRNYFRERARREKRNARVRRHTQTARR